MRIHERAESPRELGFGLLLAPNALAALKALGIHDKVVRTGVQTTNVEIRRLNGRLVRRFSKQPGGPYVVALRPELHGALLDAVGASSLRLRSEAVSFAQTADEASVTFADGQRDSADILIGADGVNSIVRRGLHPDEAPPRASGFCAVRGVAHGAGEYLHGLSAVGYLDDGMEVATARAGADAVYWYMSLLASELQNEPHTAADIVANRSHLFEQPLKSILAATAAADMRFDELLQRDPLPVWGSGRVTLLGDAAHPVLPHTGQGAAQALEDAVRLGTALSGAGTFDEGLRRYEAERLPRTRKFIRLGPRIARVTTTRNKLIRALRTAAIKVLPG